LKENDWKGIYDEVKDEKKTERQHEVDRIKQKLEGEKEVKFTNRITTQQLDPYERKRRLAVKQQERELGTQPIGASIIRSKKESRLALELERNNMNPSVYLQASEQQYLNE
jgi:hypothetical protein